MTLKTVAIEIYADETKANLAAAQMGAPPRNMTEVLTKKAAKKVIYDNFFLSTAEITLAPADGSIWVVIGSK
jgi:hypothetical protein